VLNAPTAVQDISIAILFALLMEKFLGEKCGLGTLLIANRDYWH